MQVRRTTPRVALARFTLTRFLAPSVHLLQIRGIRSKTENTSNSRKSFIRSKTESGKNFSSSRKKNISNSPDSMRMIAEGSRSSSGTSNRRSNCNKDTPSSSSGCRKDSQHHAPLRREKRKSTNQDSWKRISELLGTVEGGCPHIYLARQRDAAAS